MQVNKILAMLYRAITDRKIRFAYLSKFGLFNKMPDERYLKLKYKNVLTLSIGWIYIEWLLKKSDTAI